MEKSFSNSNEIYTGQVKNGKKHGIGRVCHKTDGMYEGEFANGEFSGFGRYILNT